MIVDNQEYYGHLVDSDNFNTTYLQNDLYMTIENPYASIVLELKI